MPQFSIKTLFLIDGLGALLSASLLGLVLPRFEDSVGMPPAILYPLAGVAGLFCLYSLTCYTRPSLQQPRYLRLIAGANLSYCALTLGCVIYLTRSLSWLGHAYFIGEIMLVVGLALVEMRQARLADAPRPPLSS